MSIPKRHSIFLLFIVVFFSGRLSASDTHIPSGSRSAAIGGSSLTYADLWSAFNNQAGLSKINGIAVGVTNEFRFMIPELNIRGLAVAMATKKQGVFALSLSYFGFSLYNEKKIGLAYARSFGDKFSAGLQFNYLGVHVDEGGKDKAAFTVEAGIRATLIKNLVIAAHVSNPTRAKLAEYNDERFPTVLKIGLGYTLSDKVIFSMESEKNLVEKNIIRAGVEYHIAKPLYIRTGVSTGPGLYSFGFGLVLNNFSIDASSTYHEVLGFSPQLSLAYIFK